jgi:hypothetical protein
MRPSGRAADALRQARERLRATAASPSRHAGEAGEALRLIDPTVDELYRAERALVPQPQAAQPAQADGGK